MQRIPRKAALKCSENLQNIYQTGSRKKTNSKQTVLLDPKLKECFVVLEDIKNGSMKNVFISDPLINESTKSLEIVLETPKEKQRECFVMLSRINADDIAQSEPKNTISDDVYDYFSNSQDNVSEDLNEKNLEKNLIAKLKKEKKITVVKKRSRIKKAKENKNKKWDEKLHGVAVKSMVLRKKIQKQPFKRMPDPKVTDSFNSTIHAFENNDPKTSTPKSKSCLPSSCITISDNSSYIPNDSHAENIEPHFTDDDNFENNEENISIHHVPVSPIKTYHRPWNRQPLMALPMPKDDISVYFGFCEDISTNSKQLSSTTKDKNESSIGSSIESSIESVKKPSKSNLHDKLRQLRHIKASGTSNLLPSIVPLVSIVPATPSTLLRKNVRQNLKEKANNEEVQKRVSYFDLYNFLSCMPLLISLKILYGYWIFLFKIFNFYIEFIVCAFLISFNFIVCLR